MCLRTGSGCRWSLSDWSVLIVRGRARTNGSDEHGQPPERGDGVREVLLRVVQLLDVAADVLQCNPHRTGSTVRCCGAEPRAVPGFEPTAAFVVANASRLVSAYSRSKELLQHPSLEAQDRNQLSGFLVHNSGLATEKIASHTRAPEHCTKETHACTSRSLWSALRLISPILPKSSSMDPFALARSSLRVMLTKE